MKMFVSLKPLRRHQKDESNNLIESKIKLKYQQNKFEMTKRHSIVYINKKIDIYGLHYKHFERWHALFHLNVDLENRLKLI